MTGEGWPFNDDADHPLSRTLNSLKWRVVGSIVLPFLWLSALLLFYTFWATGFSLAQDLVVGVVAVLTLLAAVIGMWLSFAFRAAGRWVSD